MESDGQETALASFGGQADRRRLGLAYLVAMEGAATAALESADAGAATEAAAWAEQAVAAVSATRGCRKTASRDR